MSTNLRSLAAALPEVFPAGDLAPSFSISLLARVQAVPVRLMHAWSVPEYMETWLTSPHGETVRFHTAKHSSGSFAIDLLLFGRSIRTIAGEFTRVCPSGIHLQWQLSTASGVSRTDLDVEFQARGSETLVLLRHSGFTDADESIWHQSLWQSSLARMHFLIR